MRLADFVTFEEKFQIVVDDNLDGLDGYELPEKITPEHDRITQKFSWGKICLYKNGTYSIEIGE